MTDLPRPDGGVPNVGTVDVVLKVIRRHVNVYKIVLIISLLAGAIATPLVFSVAGLLKHLTSVVASSGGGATAVGALPFVLYLRWSSRHLVIDDYRRLLLIYRRNPSKLDPTAFRTVTDIFWSLYREVTK